MLERRRRSTITLTAPPFGSQGSPFGGQSNLFAGPSVVAANGPDVGGYFGIAYPQPAAPTQYGGGGGGGEYGQQPPLDYGGPIQPPADYGGDSYGGGGYQPVQQSMLAQLGSFCKFLLTFFLRLHVSDWKTRKTRGSWQGWQSRRLFLCSSLNPNVSRLGWQRWPTGHAGYGWQSTQRHEYRRHTYPINMRLQPDSRPSRASWP